MTPAYMVAQIFNLLYRSFATCRHSKSGSCVDFAKVLPNQEQHAEYNSAIQHIKNLRYDLNQGWLS